MERYSLAKYIPVPRSHLATVEEHFMRDLNNVVYGLDENVYDWYQYNLLIIP